MAPGWINKLHARQTGSGGHQLTAVAASEDTTTENWIEEFCVGVTRQLGNSCQVIKQSWLLSELRTPHLRAIAATDAAGADIVIVALHAAESVPPEVRSWIDLWLAQRKPRPCVLLALFDPPHRGVSMGMQTYLQQVAKTARIEFVVESEDAEPED